jgi:hypothetical protein
MSFTRLATGCVRTRVHGWSARKRSLAEAALVVAGFSLLTVALTAPLAFRLGSVAYRSDNADGQFSVWNTAWVARTLLVNPLGVFNANIFYPHSGTLAYSEANLGSGALAIPIYWLTGNPHAAHGFVVLLSFLVSAVGAYALVRYLTRDRVAAVCAGVAFGFCPHVFAHLLHIQLLWTAGLPWCLLCFHRLSDQPSPRRGLLLGLAMAAQVYLCAYYAVFLVLIVGLLSLLEATRHGWRNRAYLGAMTVAAVVSIVLAFPLMWQYAEFRRATGFYRPLSDADRYSADWRAYLASATYAHGWILAWLGRWNEVLFPGFVAVLFAAIGMASIPRQTGRSARLAALYGCVGLLALWASFGPSAGLYDVLYKIYPPMTFMRAPSRLGIVVVLATTVLAGFGIAEVRRRKWVPHWAAVLLVALTVAEHVVPLEFQPVPQPTPAYRTLASLPYGALLEMPVYSRGAQYFRARYMEASTLHWMPLVNGYSDYTPPTFQERLDVLGDFPSETSMALMKQDGVRYAMFHIDIYGPLWPALAQNIERFSNELTLRYADDRTRLYELTGSAEPQVTHLTGGR